LKGYPAHVTEFGSIPIFEIHFLITNHAIKDVFRYNPRKIYKTPWYLASMCCHKNFVAATRFFSNKKDEADAPEHGVSLDPPVNEYHSKKAKIDPKNVDIKRTKGETGNQVVLIV
jgi:hypothetical protein